MPGCLGAHARRRVTLVFAIIVVLIACAAGASAEPSGSPGHYEFHPHDTQYKYVGEHGTFTGDAIYANAGPFGDNRLIWSLRLSPYVQHLVHGTMNCGASVWGKPGYHDLHNELPADYWWHSKVTGLQLDKQYRFYARCDFTATNGQVTSPGSVEYRVEFTLHSR